MSYRLSPDETIEDGLRRIAREQIDKALGEVEDSDLGHPETVHQVRKRCKKLRALLRLVRPAFETTYEKENAFFRDAARELSELRDASSRVECLDGLIEHFGPEAEGLPAVRESLSEEAERRYEKSDVDQRLSRFHDAMRAARGRVGGFELDVDAFDAVAAGSTKTYRRARKAMEAAYDEATSDAFHEWRKRVKYHRYHVRLLRNLWEPIFEARREVSKRLTDRLGEAHDLAVTRSYIVEHPGSSTTATVSSVAALADVRRAELRALALPLGRRLFADEPKSWSKRLERIWEAFRAEQDVELVMK